MTTDYIGDGSPSTLAANLRQWVDSVPSHARPLLVAAADALVAPVAPVDALAMQYLALTDAMGYNSGDDGVQWSPEEWAADLVKRANAAAPAAPAEPDEMLPHLICAAIAHEGKLLTVADFKDAADRVVDLLARRASSAAPVAPALVPLTDEQIRRLDWCADIGGHDDVVEIVRATEAAHGIKP